MFKLIHNILCLQMSYYVQKSKLLWEIGYFDRFQDHDPYTDPHLGLFQTHYGKFNISVIGNDIISIPKSELHPLQKRYQMESGYDEDYVICPTLQSILTGNVPLQFRMNHSHDNPTHKLCWIPHSNDYPESHYKFEGIDEIDSDTEVTFDYKLGPPVIYKF